MSSERQEKLDKLKGTSAWTFDEILVLLTGAASTQIEYFKSRVHSPAPDIRNVLMLETRKITWLAGRETGGGRVLYLEGEVIPFNKTRAKHFIDNGWAKDSETSAERGSRLKKEECEYRQARRRSTLMEMLERAIQDRDIESLNDIDAYPREKWRLYRTSDLQWIHTNEEKVSQLRHFPNNMDDILGDELRLFKENHPTADKPVAEPEQSPLSSQPDLAP